MLAKRPVNQTMSGFYYTSPSQHREGHRPRGRPPFSHKKHINDKRGRGVGRSPNRNSSRERDHQEERENEQDTSSRKHYSKHSSEMQHRSSYPRYSSPSRNNRHGEDVDSSGSDRSQSNKDSASSPSANTDKKSSESSSNKQAIVKSHRRDAPREKQRLTQDLARQKRLLSEDIARAQRLQKEQITNNHDTADKKENDSDSPQEQFDGSDDLDRKECNSGKESELTMYEKCYGSFAVMSPGDDSPAESRKDEEPTSTATNKNKTESLFERILSKGAVKEAKQIEFVNESQLEMRSDEEKYDSELAKGSLASPTSDIANSRVDLNRKVKLPDFENVTDDELNTSENEGSGLLKNFNNASSKSQVVSNRGLSDMQLQDKHSSNQSLEKVTNSCSPKDPIRDSNENNTCECLTQDGSIGDDTPNLFSKINGNENADCQSDHSNINTSKMSQILEEPNIQCEHSLKNKGECNNEENDVEGISSPCYELENSINEAENNVVNKKIAHAQYGVGKQSEDGYDKTESPNNDITEELESNKEMDTASLEQDTDVSNNEGMSDAEELSDLEPVTSTGRSKVKRKTRKKVKNTKAVVKTTSSPQRLPRRSKTGRRIGRPPKASKQLRQLDSDSDEQESLDYRTENKEDVQRSKSQSPKNELSGVDGKNDENSAAVEENCLEEHETLPENRDGGKTDETKDADDIDDDDELSTPSLQHQDSDTEDASQDIFSLTETERQQLEEQGRKERARKDKRIAARQKRKSIEREREKERATPPHLVSQNRFARDLPRHNWLVERLLQQKKLGEEALKPDSNQNSDNPEGNSDEEGNPGEDLPVGLEELKYAETDVNAQDKPKENLSDSAEMKNDPPSPQRDEFQSELHRSFLRRSFPPNVPRTPPKLKPASPDNSSSTESKPMPPTLKHKLQSKEHSALEPIPKLKKIVPEKTNETEENSTKEEKSNENERSSSPKENESTRKQVSPIEIFDDDDDKKKQEASEDSKVSKSSSSPVTSSSFSSEKLLSEKKEESHSPRLSSFSPPKKNMPYPSSKKVVHSVSPTLPGSGKEISSHPMGPHHRAAILIPVVPMHDANGLPLPPSLGPTSPHMKPYSPRTFTPHLITHNPTFSTAGFFSGLPPANRYPSASCHHHFHPGMKPGPCKRDVNCPFHGSPTRGLPPGILGLPSHHPSMAAFNPHGHDHISQILAREHREGHCPNSDCKMCRQGKESPKIRELDSQSNQEKTSPQPSKVVKPIAHVPGMRPPLMLSHLQQFGGRPTQAFSDIDSIQEEKARRSGMEPILSPRQKINSSPERSSRDSLAPGLFTTERRSLPHHFTLSDLNRRREQDLMKGPQDLLSSIKHRPMPGEFMVPGFASAPSHSKPGLIHPKDSTLFTSSRSQSVVVSQADKREFSRGEERDRSGFLSDSLKSGPPRLRSMEERDALAMRTLSEHKRREELAMRENPALLRQMTSKEGVGLPPAKLFEDRELAQSRDQGMPPLSRSAKDFDVRLMSSHGNSSILGPALRGLEDHRKMSEEERKGINREEREQGARRSADSETRERELREEQAMDALDRRRSLEQMREKEQEKRTMSEREGMRSMAMERDRIKNQFLRGVESEKHFKSQLGMPRDRSPPFLRRDMYQDRLIDPSRPDHRLDLRAAALHDLQRRQEMFRAGESSHRELLGRIASNHSVNKSLHPADKHFAERFPVEIARSLAETRSHSPSRGYPISMASRQAMDRLAAAAQGKSLPHSKDLDKDIPPHLRTVSPNTEALITEASADDISVIFILV